MFLLSNTVLQQNITAGNAALCGESIIFSIYRNPNKRILQCNSVTLFIFRVTDFRLQGTVLRRQLQSMADLLPPSLQEGYMESCESLVEDPDPLIAAQEIRTVLREFLPPEILPEGLIEICMTCLEQYVRNKVQGSDRVACSGVFWVNLGLLQIKVWTPQTIFDPAMKRSYKLIYAQQEVSTCLFLTPTKNLHFLQQQEQEITA